MSRRVLRCSCGERQARVWQQGFGTGLFIHCDACKRNLYGPPFRLKEGGRHGYLLDMTRKELEKYREELLQRWERGESSTEDS